MEPNGLLPNLQEPSTAHYPESDASISLLSTLFP
jgi:hypothetical protein